jgi:membrane fusion protein (multidrug efflux system)
MESNSDPHGAAPGPAASQPPPPARHPVRNASIFLVFLGALALAGVFAFPLVITAVTTVSTDDAYVNGHVTFVAPRVSGQVKTVFVDDNYRVAKGQLLVELDPEPYEVIVKIKQAAVESAKADLAAAESQVRGLFAQARSQRWKLQTTMENVDNQIALLNARIAVLRSKEATLERAKADLERAKDAYKRNANSKQDLDQATEALGVAQALANQSLQEIYEVRVSLGLAPHPKSNNLNEVPDNLRQTFSSVRQALADLVQTIAQLGLTLASSDATPEEALADFRKKDPEGNIDRIIEKLVPEAPAVLQAKSKLLQAQADLRQAALNLSYCKVYAEIDGVVTRRNINPGNNVQAAQQLMAVRSLKEIWIDANFKETQLAKLRIGQRVELVADTYGSGQKFQGRITGFTYGTGSTLALLPAQNATGNFVKVVQRLPVRIELENYDPESQTLYAGLSMTPYVYFREAAEGANAGKRLQDPSLPGTPTPVLK